MFQVGKYILLTPLKEERQLIELLVQVCSFNLNQKAHRKTVHIVYKYLIEDNRDLLLDTFNAFLRVAKSLGIETPEFNAPVRYGQIVGSRPRRIPCAKADPEGHRTYLDKRRQRREQFVLETLLEAKKDRGIFEQLKSPDLKTELTQINEKLDILVDMNSKLDALMEQSRDSDGRINEESLKKNMLKLVVDNTKSA